MAQTLEQLMNGLPDSEEEIRRQAQQRYQSVYDQKKLSAQQAYEMNDAALARELSALQKNYDAQRSSAAAQTRNTYSQADRHALSRGMQRSSYNESTLAGIDLAGAQTQSDIDRAQSEQEAEIGEKRTLLSSQLSQTLRQLETDRLNDELAYADELTRQLFEYQLQLKKENDEQARWQAEFDAKYGSGGSASRSSGRSAARAGETSSPKTAVKVSGVRNTIKEMKH